MPIRRKYSTRARGYGSSTRPRSVTGGGKYSFGRAMRKNIHGLKTLGTGIRHGAKWLGIGELRKQAADVGRARASAYLASAGGGSTTGSGAYMSRGLVGGRGMYVDNASANVRKGQYHGPNYSSFKGGKADDGAVIVSNQEFFQYLYAPEAVGDVIPYESFSTDVQPGTMCPLLSQMAVNFERYEMKQCMFHFETSLDGAALQSSTGQVGDIMMVSHMDVNSPDYTNSSEFEHNSSHVVSTRVTSGLTCGVECDPKQMNGLLNGGINLIRSSKLTTKEDKAKFDQARVQIALNNLNPALAGRCLGRVYISYTVKLIKQRLYSAIGRTIRSDEYTYRTTSSWDPVTQGFKGTTKSAEEPFNVFVAPDPSNPTLTSGVVLPYKEEWSSLGTTIEPIRYTANFDPASPTLVPQAGQDSEAFRIKFDSNMSGLYRVTLKAVTQVVRGTVSGSPDIAYPEFQVPFVGQITCQGTTKLVSFRDRIPTDATTTMNEYFASSAGSGSPGAPTLNEVVDVFGNTFIAATQSNTDTAPGYPDGTIVGTFDVYFRVSPATSNVANSMEFNLLGMCGSSDQADPALQNTNQIMQSSIRIEQVNDHERLAPLKISTVDDLDPN